jgi:hypothetical protein
MNDQLILDNFLETILESDKETINYNGIEIAFLSLAQAELDRQFNLSLKNKISPNEFEKKIEETQLCTKFNLETKYKIYYLLLYNICYFKKNKINLLNRNDLKFKELNELLFATEEEIVQYYKKIKQYNLN